MIGPQDVFKIGCVSRTHGVAGEVEIRFTDDVFDRTDADYLFLQIDGLLVPFFIDEYRFKSNETVIMKFDGIDDARQAQTLCTADVFFPLSLIPEREEAPLSWAYLHGFSVYGEDGTLLGEVESVDDTSANILLTIRRKDGTELLVPFHPELLLAHDEKKRTLTLRLPEGLLTLND